MKKGVDRPTAAAQRKVISGQEIEKGGTGKQKKPLRLTLDSINTVE